MYVCMYISLFSVPCVWGGGGGLGLGQDLKGRREAEHMKSLAYASFSEQQHVRHHPTD